MDERSTISIFKFYELLLDNTKLVLNMTSFLIIKWISLKRAKKSNTVQGKLTKQQT